MDTFFGRYRNTSILMAVLFAQVLALAVQVKRPSESGSTSLIRVWVVNAVTPLEKLLVSSGHGARGFWGNYLYLRGVRRENRELRQELEQLRIEQVRLHEDAVQAHRLQALFDFKEQFVSGTVPAQVIGTSGSDLSRVFYIDKGAKDGVKVDMAVITPEGIVGKVLRVFNSSSQVLGINDASSGVGAILEKSRLQGILQGTSAGDVVMRYVMSDEKVEPGERVLTSGGDRIFPKGLPIGTVQQTSPGSDLFLNIRVKPSANLGRVEEVLVITKVVEKEPDTTEASGPIRAADILAERLPSVQKKTAGDANAAKTASGATGATTVQNAAAITKAAGTEPNSSKPGLSGPPTIRPTTAGAGATPGETESGKPGSSGPPAATSPLKANTATTTAPKQLDRFSPPVV
ncbi:MAG: rod shape-determining protein MreC, partial [Acidobacteriaceae bacterium]|nr:rod shape-determining protein MreC [Acidobacteriaceae bacterium]